VLYSYYEPLIGDAVDSMFQMLDLFNVDVDSETYQEYDGIAEVLERPTYQVLMLNSLYELDAWCTAIVGRLSNGTIFMARNLDFYFANETRKVAYIGRFYNGDSFLFESVMFAGLTSVFTGFKPKAFALSLNERTSKKDEIELALNLERLMSGFQRAGSLMREILIECSDY
jgi:hypothetical protein